MGNLEIEQSTTNQTVFEKNKTLFKGLLIGGLILLMLIPVSMLTGLVTEREERQNEVITEISNKWASAQTITGPVISVPYLVNTNNSNTPAVCHAYLLPEQLNIDGKLLPEVRHRSLYDVTLYRSNITLSGMFDPLYLLKIGITPETVLWDQCQLMFGVDDIKELEDDVNMKWNDSNTVLESGLPENNILKNGLNARVALNAQNKIPFSINVKLKGSSRLYFTPVGKTTQVSLASPWKDPAFDGQYLPSQSNKTADGGFTAQWKVLQVSRSYPQAWKDKDQYHIDKSSFGVKLLQPTDGYAKTERSIKYAILIISLTFAISFFAEILKKQYIHPLQYILVGIALCVFYTLLLSISEYVGYNAAYFISSVATIVLISLYVLGIFKKVKIALGFGIALSTLYAYIFMLIQLQDYALLFGSIGLFAILAVIMGFSRKIDWYNTTKTTN